MESAAELLKRIVLSRRQLLRYAAAGAAVAVARPTPSVAGCGAVAAPAASPAGSLPASELAILDAATAAIIPTDSDAGCARVRRRQLHPEAC